MDPSDLNMKTIKTGFLIGVGLVLCLAVGYFVLSVIGYSMMGPETLAAQEDVLMEYLKSIQR